MTRSGASRGAPAPARREPANGDAVTQSMVVRAEQQSEQRFGSAAWCTSVVLAAVVCVY